MCYHSFSDGTRHRANDIGPQMASKTQPGTCHRQPAASSKQLHLRSTTPIASASVDKANSSTFAPPHLSHQLRWTKPIARSQPYFIKPTLVKSENEKQNDLITLFFNGLYRNWINQQRSPSVRQGGSFSKSRRSRIYMIRHGKGKRIPSNPGCVSCPSGAQGPCEGHLSMGAAHR